MSWTTVTHEPSAHLILINCLQTHVYEFANNLLLNYYWWSVRHQGWIFEGRDRIKHPRILFCRDAFESWNLIAVFSHRDNITILYELNQSRTWYDLQPTTVKDDGSITIDYEYSIEFWIINGISNACLYNCFFPFVIIKLSKCLFIYLSYLFI